MATVLARSLVGGVVLDPVGAVEDNVVDSNVKGLLVERFGGVVRGGAGGWSLSDSSESDLSVRGVLISQVVA